MAITLTRLKEGYNIEGKFQSQIVDVTFDSSYPTGGEPVAAKDIGLSIIHGARQIGAKNATSAGYVVQWDYDDKKLIVMRSAGFTPAGTNGTSAVSGNVTVVGGSLGEAIGINTDSNAGVLSKAAATNRTIPIATFLGAAPTAAAQTFTGTAVAAAALVEVANGVNLSSVTVRMQFFGL